MCWNTLSRVVWNSPADPLHSDHSVISRGRSARPGRTERETKRVRAPRPRGHLDDLDEPPPPTVSGAGDGPQPVHADLCQLLQQLSLPRQLEEETAAPPRAHPGGQELGLQGGSQMKPRLTTLVFFFDEFYEADVSATWMR